MNKKELVNAVSENVGYTKKDTALVVESVFNIIASTLSQGEDVKISDFGTFKIKHRAERKARNIHTGEDVVVPATKIVSFKPAKYLKDVVK